MDVFAWVVQAMLASVFLAHGLLFLFSSPTVQEIRKRLPFPVGFMRSIYAAEILAALGLVLPGLTGILPWLTPLAAVGLVPIMGSAVVFHLSRREIASAIFAAVLLALAACVALVRWSAFPN
jgi:uncharacterized membrane protein YphA (DoxX/SURF4 family)